MRKGLIHLQPMRSGEIAGLIVVAIMFIVVASAFIVLAGLFGLAIALLATPMLIFAFVGVVMKVSEWKGCR